MVDVGMTGVYGGVAGVAPDHFLARLKGEDPAALPPFGFPAGPVSFGAVRLRIEGNHTTEIERLT